MSYTSVTHRDGWCCTFPTVRGNVDSSALTVLLQEYITSFLSPVLYSCAAHIWVKNCKELLPSSYNKARFDQPLQANDWLRNFRTTNENFLSKVTKVDHIRQSLIRMS